MGITQVPIRLVLFLILLGTGSIHCSNESSFRPAEPLNRTYAPDGKGWLIVTPHDKVLVHLEGEPYEMGFQQGYLLADRLSRVLSNEFYVTMALELLEMDLHDIEEILASPLPQIVIDFLISSCRNNLHYIPPSYVREMEGIVDGARAAGYPGASFDRVLLTNLGFDALLSIGYPLVTPFLPLVPMPVHTCDGFIVTAAATTSGQTFMARSWMMSPVVSKNCVVFERLPENGHKMVDVSLPGFVGIAVGMNDQGIGIGMDMVPSTDCLPQDFGMGTLLTARTVLEEADELSHAVSSIETTKRGVSWLYLIGDGRGPEHGGVAVESTAHYFEVRPIHYVPPVNVPIGWPPQIEDGEDVLVYANHFLVPSMVRSHTFAIDDSLWRYETLTRLVLGAYGRIDEQKARDLLDYLHPPHFHYYHGPYLDGVRSLFDLTHLRSWSLYGRWDDPWVEHSLTP